MEIKYIIILTLHNLILKIIFYTIQYFNSKELLLEFIFSLVGKYYHVSGILKMRVAKDHRINRSNVKLARGHRTSGGIPEDHATHNIRFCVK